MTGTGEASGFGPWLDRFLGRAGPRAFFRNVGAVAIAIIAVWFPEVGPYRYWLAGILILVCIPAAEWLERRYPFAETGWSQPLFDLTMVVLLVHLVPSMWFPALVIGLMIVQAPSISESHSAHLFYAAFATILTVGMTVAAVVHDVPGWELPILSMVVLYPSIIFYSYRQAMRANERRERAAALDGLQLVAGGVAHDFNNVLMGVLGLAELARNRLAADHPARRPIEDVIGGANRASLLAAQLLAFSGRAPAAPVDVDLGEELSALVSLLRPVVPAGVELEFARPDATVVARADRAQLQQVVMNLVLNAAESTAARPDRVLIHVAPRGRWAEITVLDRGVGVPRELQGRVFEPFFSGKEGGHGLGLASAREIVVRLDGELDFESEEGVGTEVRLRLPAVEKDQPTAVEKPGPAATEHPRVPSSPVADVDGRNVAFVIDDEKLVRDALDGMLDSLGYGVRAYGSAREALEALGDPQTRADVILLDIRMPDLDGWQALERIRAHRPQVGVLMISGLDPTRTLAPDDANLRLLRKPFGPDRLEEELDRLTGRAPT